MGIHEDVNCFGRPFEVYVNEEAVQPLVPHLSHSLVRFLKSSSVVHARMDNNELPPYSLVRTHCATGKCQGGCVMWCGPWRERKRTRKPPVSGMQAGDEKTRASRVPYLRFKRIRYAVRTLVAIEHRLPAASPRAQFSTNCGNYWCVAPEHLCLWQVGRPLQKRPERSLALPMPHDED